ncbi:MAG: patatin-like phospholipase family protein [Bacillaceae bacterium]|nr:patatin-like phospholipase family protein [Bacillaceae bacterium]
MTGPRVGLALGSGGARGLAHIGVLKVLERHQIPVHMMAGSSMGSLIGAFYACGLDPDMLEKLALNLKRKHWMDVTVPGMGFINGNKIKDMIRMLTRGKNIEDLDIPFAVVATDIESRERVVFRRGPIADAVRASISIPGIFVPERIDGRLLVDGGVIDRVPISVVKDMGADIVLAVDVAMNTATFKISTIFDVIAQTIDVMEQEIFRHRVADADVMIRPDVGNYSATSYTNLDKIIDEGERAAESVIDQIKEHIRQFEQAEKGDRNA